MGTNYYLHDNTMCSACGRGHEPRHIGKSSIGWCFSLHVIPEDNINSLDDWMVLLGRQGSRIVDEYGTEIDSAGMIEIITNRKGIKGWDEIDWPYGGYAHEKDFHERNNSEKGPNGLLRHKIGSHCIGHGDGTWDLIAGEFC